AAATRPSWRRTWSRRASRSSWWSIELDRARAQQGRPAAADAAGQAPLAGFARPGRPRHARRAQAASAAPAARLLGLRRRAAGAEPAVGRDDAAVRGAAGESAVQPVLPEAGRRRAREIDLLEERHDRGDVHEEARGPERQQVDEDDALLDGGSDLLGQHRT